jgi:hypothetical protein
VRLHGDTSAIICCYEEIDNEEYLKKKQNKTKPLKQQSDGRKKQTSNNVNKGAPLFKLYMNKYQLIDKSTTSLAFFCLPSLPLLGVNYIYQKRYRTLKRKTVGLEAMEQK